MNATDTIEFRLKSFKASSSFTPGDPLSFDVVLNEEHGLPGKFDAGDYLGRLGVSVADKNVLVVCPGNGGLCVEALKSGASTVVALEPRGVYDKSLSAISDFASEVIGATFSRRSVDAKLVEKFDVVVWSEGLDEIVHPKEIFEKVIRSIAPGGSLFIEVAHGTHGKLPDSINAWRPTKEAFKETLDDYPSTRVVTTLEGRDQVRTIYGALADKLSTKVQELDKKATEAVASYETASTPKAKAEALAAATEALAQKSDALVEAGVTPDAPRHVHIDMAKDAKDIDKETVKQFAERLQAEVDESRKDYADKMAPFVSKEFIQKEVLKLSEEEIEEVKKADAAQEQKTAERLAAQIKGMMPTDAPVEDNLDSIYEGRESTPKSKKKKGKKKTDK